MNLELLKPEVQEWISSNLNSPLPQLAFQKSPFPNISTSELLTQINSKKKLKSKVKWLTKEKNIIYPPSLNLEQSSSWETATYKAQLFRNANQILDLTGGFGIDSLAFAETATVIHTEPHLELQSIAERNFKTLKKNIKSYHASAKEIIEKFPSSSYYYLDPSRRDENQNKVFLISDLNPNPVEIIKKIQTFKKIVIKLSPLFDLTALAKVFSNASCFHIIAVRNEVKEILVEIDEEKNKYLEIKAINLSTDDEVYHFIWQEAYKPQTFCGVKSYLYEPNVAIQKTQNFLKLETQFNITKLAPNTHLWAADEFFANFPGRVFKFLKPLENLKKELKNESVQIIHRNFPEKIQVLKKRYKFRADGQKPVFFTSDTESNLCFWAKQMK